MPPIYKILVTLLVCLLAGGAHIFRDTIQLGASPWMLAWLVGLLVLGLWLFPEPKKRAPKDR